MAFALLNQNIDLTGGRSDSLNDSILAQDQIMISHLPSPTLAQALTTYVSRTSTGANQQRSTENLPENSNLLNVSSRVSIFIGKYPDDATLRNYSDLQRWMFTHSNKRAPIDICQSLNRMFLTHIDHYDHHKLFNLYLICTEAYQTTGNVEQAYCYYGQAKILAEIPDDAIMTYDDVMEKKRKIEKISDLGMKLEFQSEFQHNLIKRHRRPRFDSMNNDFLENLDMTSRISAEECRSIWRQIVLQCVINPNSVIPSAKWLFLYADRFLPTRLQHANILYVALNLLLLAHGSSILSQHPNIFQMLDRIACYFEENGDQSKQFSPVHKMAHIWGTAAVAFHLVSDKQKYLVCACIMRVSFELLDIRFLSSGIESLYILAQIHAPDFFNMMAMDPCVKFSLPECINYLRREVENNKTCIRYSTEIVDQYVRELFNLDQTDHRR